MKFPSNLQAIAVASAVFALFFTTTAKAGHVYAGIIDTNGTPGLQAGDALAFLNIGSSAEDPARGKPITGVDYGNVAVRGKVTDTSSPQANLFATKEPTFTALSRGTAMGRDGYVKDLKESAASAHSFIELKLVSVTGPKGAQFSFWETGSATATFTYTIGTGLTLGAGIFHLTNPAAIIGDGKTPLPPVEKGSYTYPHYGYSPNPAGTASMPDGLPAGFLWNHSQETNDKSVQDPFGHIHGRRFTFNQPGNYSVTYILTDASGTQADSAPFTMTYTVSTEEAARPAAASKPTPSH
jgi:hypothetical protein